MGVALVAAFLATGVVSRGLFEASEGRYASIAAAMVRTGDYLVPHVNGLAHFEKPPLASWAMAAGLLAFGHHVGAVRLPGLLAALLCVGCAWLLDGRRIRAPLLLLASPIFFGMASVVTTDIYLAAAAAVSLLGMARAIERTDDPRARSRWAALAVAASALGFLTKGPVIWILTLGPLLCEAVWSRRWRELRAWFAPRHVALFLVLAVPWFLAIGARYPGLLQWFVSERTVGALASSRGFHAGPFYYFVPLFLLGFLPGSLVFLLGFRAGLPALRNSRTNRLLACAVIFPFLVFSASSSKLGTYILPLSLPTALLASQWIETPRGRRGVTASGAGLLAFVLAVAVFGFWSGRFAAMTGLARGLFLGAGLAALAGGSLSLRWSRGDRPARGWKALLAGQIITLLFAAPAIGQAEAQIVRNGPGHVVASTASALAGPRGAIVCYRTFLFTLPFYLDHDVPTVEWMPRSEGRYAPAPSGLELDVEDLRRLARETDLVVICKAKNVEELEALVEGLSTAKRVGKHAILWNGSSAPSPPATEDP